VILTIAAKTASSEIGEYLPSPGVIISLGLVASFEPSGFALRTSPEYVLNGAAAAGVGVAFALAIALLSPHLRGRVDIDRFRFGSAVALGVLALPILLGPFDIMQTEAPIALAVLGVTTLFAYDPNAGPAGDSADDGAGDDPDGDDAPDIDDADEIDDGIVTDDDAERDGDTEPTEPPLDAPTAPAPIVDDDVAVAVIPTAAIPLEGATTRTTLTPLRMTTPGRPGCSREADPDLRKGSGCLCLHVSPGFRYSAVNGGYVQSRRAGADGNSREARGADRGRFNPRSRIDHECRPRLPGVRRRRHLRPVGYMPSVTEFITGYKCQECDWSADDREE